MLGRPYESLTGRVSDLRTGYNSTLIFKLDGKSATLDPSRTGSSPIVDGAVIDVVARQGLVFRSIRRVLAYRLHGTQPVYTEDRWLPIALIAAGVFVLLVLLYMAVTPAYPGSLRPTWDALAISLVMVLYGVQQLRQLASARDLLASTPGDANMPIDRDA